MALLLASTAYSGECPILRDTIAPAEPTATASIKDRASYQQRLWEFSKASARALFSRYHAGKLSSDEIEACQAGHPDSKSFQQLLPQIFFEETVAILRESRSLGVQDLMRRLDSRLVRTKLPLFKLVGHFKIEAPTDSKAGFHRGSGSIFLNFAKINPNEWLIIFIHEVLHGLDETLTQAISEYGHQPTAKAIAALSRTKSEPAQCSRPEREMIDRWLMAGLNRGFLAEVRAWSATAKIYEDGLREGLWERIEWMERLLAKRHPSQPMDRFMLETLGASFEDPRDGIFSLPLVAESLRQLRARL